MPSGAVPRKSSDVLKIPEADVPAVITELMTRRAFSGLVTRIHEEMRAPDPGVQTRAREALNRLGFTD